MRKMGAVTDKPTDTDPTVRASWAIDDGVTRLREWASDHAHELRGAAMTIGSARECELRLRDNSGQVSRRHAQLVAHGAAWKLRDLDSKNGLWRDGFRTLDFTLAAGIVIGIGGLRLIAESARFIALRGVVSRLLGWQQQNRVDEALASLRLCGARQSRRSMSARTNHATPTARFPARFRLRAHICDSSSDRNSSRRACRERAAPYAYS